MSDIAAMLAAAAFSLTCEAPNWRFTLTVSGETCAINHAEGFVAGRDPAFECRVSNPQLRTLAVARDGRFVYEDTDDDTVLAGICQPRP